MGFLVQRDHGSDFCWDSVVMGLLGQCGHGFVGTVWSWVGLQLFELTKLKGVQREILARKHSEFAVQLSFQYRIYR